MFLNKLPKTIFYDKISKKLCEVFSMNEFKFKQILEICKSENMYEDIKKDDTEDFLYEYLDILIRDMAVNVPSYKQASDAKAKIMSDNEKLWNVVENHKASALSVEDAEMLIDYIRCMKDEHYEASLALYMLGVKDAINGDFTLDFNPDPLMSRKALELVVELAHETGKSVDEIVDFITK